MTITRICAAAGLAGLITLLSSSVRAGYTFASFDGPGNNRGGTTVNAIDNNGARGWLQLGQCDESHALHELRPQLGRHVLDDEHQQRPACQTRTESTIAWSWSASRTTMPFRSAPGRTPSLPSSKPPAKPGDSRAETAFGINDAGTIVGQYTQNSTDTQPGFVLANGRFTTFQATTTSIVTNVQNINNNGLAIGFYTADGVHQHGFLYDTASTKLSLIADPNVPNLVLTQFLGVNDNNLAVGYYQTPDGSQHGFLYNLLTQTYSFLDTDPNPPPRPGSPSPRSPGSMTDERNRRFLCRRRHRSSAGLRGDRDRDVRGPRARLVASGECGLDVRPGIRLPLRVGINRRRSRLARWTQEE